MTLKEYYRESKHIKLKEGNNMKVLKTKEGVAIVLILASIITNPLTGQYVEDGINWAFEQMFKYGSWISLVAGVYVIGLMLFTYQKANRLNVPSKTAKTEKAGKFIATK